MAPDPSSDARPPAPAGRKFGRYEIREEISRGGMGVVYRAWDGDLGRDVALKILRGDPDASPESVQRFWREAKAIAALRHPSIVPIHDVGIEEGVHFLTMDFVDGETLQALASSGKMDLRAALEIMAQVADAIHHAHGQGIIHRDLKPRNILVTREGRPLVTDFGLARPVESDVRITQTGMTMGTPPYMSPEQARGVWDEVGPRSDIYSLGATLFEILCGKPPFDGRTGTEILIKVVEEDPDRPRALNRFIPVPVETIVLKAMAKEPERRYETAREMAEDLRRVLAGKAILAHPPYGRLHRAARRVRRIMIGNLAIVLAALAGVAVSATVLVVAEYNDRMQRFRSTPPSIPFYDDDFDQPGLAAPGPEWSAVQGKVSLGQGPSKGRLVLAPDPDTGRCVVLNLGEKFKTHRGSLRLGFEAVVPEGEGALPPEFGCFLYARPDAPLETGYRFRWGEGFGGRQVLLKNGRPVRSDAGEAIVPGLTFFGNPRYSIRMDLYRDEVDVELNGERVFSFKDDFPQEVGRDQGCVWGFYALGTALEVDRVVADRQGVPLTASPLDFGDELYLGGNWAAARDWYSQVRESVEEGGDAAVFARYRMALCDLLLEPAAAPAPDRASPSLDALRRFANEAGSSPWFRDARLVAARRLADASPSGALDVLRPVFEDGRARDRANAAALFCFEESERRGRAALELAREARAGPPEGRDPSLARSARMEAEAQRFLDLAEKGAEDEPSLGARCALLRGDLFRLRGNLGAARRSWARGARETAGAPLTAAECGFREAQALRESRDGAGAAAVLDRLRAGLRDHPVLEALVLLELGEAWREAGNPDAGRKACEEVLGRRRGNGQDADLRAWADTGAALAAAETWLSGPEDRAAAAAVLERWREVRRRHRDARPGAFTRLWAAVRGEWDATEVASGKVYPPPARGPLLEASARLSELAAKAPAPAGGGAPEGPFAWLAGLASGDKAAEAQAEALAGELAAAKAPDHHLAYWLGLRYEALGEPDRARRCYEAAANSEPRDGPAALAQARLKALKDKGR